MALGNEISGRASWGVYDWRAYLDLETLEDHDTYMVVRLRYGYGSYWALDVYANGSCDYASSWSGSISVGGNGWWQWVQVGWADVTLSKGAEGYTKTFNARIQATGGAVGTSWVSNSVWVPQRNYEVPNPPKDFKAEYVSDNSAKLSWEGDYTGRDGAKPWDGVYPCASQDDGQFIDLADVSWDVFSYTCNSLKPGHKYAFAARSYGPGGTSVRCAESVVYTTPSAFSGLSAAKTGEASLKVTAESAPQWYDSLEWGLTSDNGASWQACQGAQASDGWTIGNVPAGTVKVRVRAVKSGRAGEWAVSNAVTTICAPNAPDVKLSKSVYATGATAVASWTPNHPDMSAQTAAEAVFIPPTGSAQTISVKGDSAKAQLQVTVKGRWSVRVRTKGLHADWGAWSSYASFSVADAPQAYFTSPTSEGEKISGLPLKVAWSITDSTGVASQRLELLSQQGAVLWRAWLQPGVRECSLSYPQHMFANNSMYRLLLTMNAGSGLSASTMRAFRTYWEPPTPPAIVVDYDEKLAASVSVFAGESTYTVKDGVLYGPMQLTEKGVEMYGPLSFADGEVQAGTAPTANSFSISRVLADGSTLQLGRSMSSGQGVVDPLPPLNTPFKYVATAYAETGAATTAESQQTLRSDKAAFNFGPDAGKAWLGYYGIDHKRKSTRTRELYHFADNGENGGLPMSYELDERDVSESWTFAIIGREDYDAFLALAEEYGECWIRDLYGDRCLVAFDWDLGRHKGPNVWDVSIDGSRCVWEEPTNG